MFSKAMILGMLLMLLSALLILIGAVAGLDASYWAPWFIVPAMVGLGLCIVAMVVDAMGQS